MGSHSKSKFILMNKTSEKSIYGTSSKIIKSTGCFKTDSQSMNTDNIEPLSLEEIMANLRNPDLAVNVSTINSLRNLCMSKKPFASIFLSSTGIISDILNICDSKKEDVLHVATIKMVAQIVKKKHNIHNVMNSISYLMRFLDYRGSRKCVEAIQALENIDFSINVLATNFSMFEGKSLLLSLIDDQIETTILKKITHILLNVLQTNSRLTGTEIVQLMAVLPNLLFHPNEEILGNVCGILDHITKSNDGIFSDILETTIIPSVVEHLNNCNLRVAIKALNVVSNFICNATSTQTRHVLEYDVISAIPKLLKHEMLQQKSLDVVIEYLQESEEGIQKVLNLNIPKFLLAFLTSDNMEVCRASFICFNIIVDLGNWQQIKSVLEVGLIQALCLILYDPRYKYQWNASIVTIRTYLNAATIDVPTTRGILLVTEKLQEQLYTLRNINSHSLKNEAANLMSALQTASLLANDKFD